MTNASNYGALLKAGRWFGGLPEPFQRVLLDAPCPVLAVKAQ